MSVQDLPVLVSSRVPGGHQVGADLHEVVEGGVVCRQSQARLAGAVGGCGVGPGPEEGDDGERVALTSSEGEGSVVTQAPHVDITLGDLDQPLHHLQLVGHGGHHEARGAREDVRTVRSSRGVDILEMSTVRSLTSLTLLQRTHHPGLQQNLDPLHVAHGAGLQEVHQVRGGPGEPGHQAVVEASLSLHVIVLLFYLTSLSCVQPGESLGRDEWEVTSNNSQRLYS